jgi:hypothetical protein
MYASGPLLARHLVLRAPWFFGTRCCFCLTLARAPQAAAANALNAIANETAGNNRKLYDFQAAVIAVRGIPLLVRLLESREHGDVTHANVAFVLCGLAAYNKENCCAIAAAGAVPPLVALLRSRSGDARVQAADGIRCLAIVPDIAVMITGAGGVPSLCACLDSRESEEVQVSAAAALCAMTGVCEEAVTKQAVAAAGGIPRLSGFDLCHSIFCICICICIRAPRVGVVRAYGRGHMHAAQPEQQ